MDREEFKQIWISLGGSLYRVAFSILKSEADAKDALQDLYIKLWNSRDNLSGISSPLGYGIRLMRNICIDRIRSGKACGVHEDIDCVGDIVAPDSTDRILAGKETLSALRSAVASLPENQRKVVELRFFRQLDYSEISRLTGLSYVNVRVLVNRARNTIMSSMKDFGI